MRSADRPLCEPSDDTGYYIDDRGMIFGPKGPTQFRLDGDRFVGPLGDSDLRLSRGQIYGTAGATGCSVKDGRIYGAARNLPWA
jgi:hypothetical protein